MSGRPDLDEEALGWVVRLTSGGSTPADHQDFRRWRDQSADHAAALTRARTLWSQLGTALPTIAAERERAVRRRGRIMRGLPIAASLLLALGIGQQYWSVWRFDQVTQVGERRQFRLPDGSRMTLSGDTAVNIDYHAGSRRIEVARGEALFVVRHDAASPFVVRHAGTEIRDIGTVFDVATVADGTRVVVREGVVEVSGNDRRAIVRANQATLVSGAGPQAIAIVDADNATGWARGRLILNNMPLATILAALQPHYDGRILLMNGDLGRQSLSAVIDLDHVDDWLDALAKRDSIHVTRVPGLTILH